MFRRRLCYCPWLSQNNQRSKTKHLSRARQPVDREDNKQQPCESATEIWWLILNQCAQAQDVGLNTSMLASELF